MEIKWGEFSSSKIKILTLGDKRVREYPKCKSLDLDKKILKNHH